jgi:hypothetical protein
MIPRMNSGVHLTTAFVMDVVIVEEEDDDDEEDDVHPAIMIKLAAPKSIQPYPLTSVLQNRRGNIGKSTANMAMAV